MGPSWRLDRERGDRVERQPIQSDRSVSTLLSLKSDYPRVQITADLEVGIVVVGLMVLNKNVLNSWIVKFVVVMMNKRQAHKIISSKPWRFHVYNDDQVLFTIVP